MDHNSVRWLLVIAGFAVAAAMNFPWRRLGPRQARLRLPAARRRASALGAAPAPRRLSPRARLTAWRTTAGRLRLLGKS